MLKTYYYKNENNFGDVATQYILDKVLEREVEWSDRDTDDVKLCLTGSIANNKIKNAIHCGTGVANINDELDENAEYISVRGLITVGKINHRFVSFTQDPMFAAPIIFEDEIKGKTFEKKYNYAVINHYIKDDYHDFAVCNGEPTFFDRNLTICKDKEEFIETMSIINNSDVVITDSLHIMITAVAFGKACVLRINQDKRILGDNTKYFDWLSNFSDCPVYIQNCFNSEVLSFTELSEKAESIWLKHGEDALSKQEEYANILISEIKKIDKFYENFIHSPK